MDQFQTYLCLLDRAHLKETSFRFGEYKIQRFTDMQLEEILRGREDFPPTEGERIKLGKYSKCTWAVLTKAIQLPESSDPTLERMLNRIDLGMEHAFRKCWYPFDDLVKTLNLLKPAQAPIRPIQFYKIPAGHVQTGDQIQRIISDEPEFLKAAPGWKGYDDYEVSAGDECGFAGLRTKLDHLSGPGQQSPSTFIEIALELFHVADRNYEVRMAEPEDLTVLLLYEASIEALFVREKEKMGVEDSLAKRVPRALASEAGEKRQCLESFVRKLFFIRSKVAHGSRPVSELVELIDDQADRGICNGGSSRTIVGGPYSSLFVAPEIQGFLANVRELARRSVRYFIDMSSARSDKDSVLSELDS